MTALLEKELCDDARMRDFELRQLRYVKAVEVAARRRADDNAAMPDNPEYPDNDSVTTEDQRIMDEELIAERRSKPLVQALSQYLAK
ncbi:hypothetical protein PLESTB_001321200 [Pleodorina starrii]|uniref:Uncharacterized protein n=1 Tax=Pleodorina starrii TaxID=330485 RepID=A0A9W6BTW4_9CHLO|nr:hypothetical protein PLESTM_001617400 [Pleodorina starrii]GLC58127.1 hypothetical protein PLESTB_001321200 [Pleodorina starrii]